MRRVRQCLLAILISLLALPLGLPALGVSAASVLPTGTPGAVEETTPLPPEIWPPGTGEANRVTYWSTGPGGRPTLASGAVYLPRGAPPEGGWPVISWAHGTTGLGDACAPSAAGRTPLDADYLAAWLGEGYAVVATDYVGLGTPGVHPYLAGRSEAHGVIDMVRAARATEPSLSASWAAVGQSQGGHATMFTANMASRYAPELDYRGAVAHGVPSNLTALVSMIGPTFPPSLAGPELTRTVTYILAGLRAARPDFDLASYLTPLGKQVLADADVLCNDDMADRLEGIELRELFTRKLGTRFEQAWAPIFDVPTSAYDRPVFIAQGINDTTVAPSLTQRLVDDLAANQQPYTYRTYAADHDGTLAAALPDATAFARRLFAPAALR